MFHARERRCESRPGHHRGGRLLQKWHGEISGLTIAAARSASFRARSLSSPSWIWVWLVMTVSWASLGRSLHSSCVSTSAVAALGTSDRSNLTFCIAQPQDASQVEFSLCEWNGCGGRADRSE